MKPVPLSVAELMVTGAVPVEVSVTGSVEAVFTVTLPNAKLAGLTVNVVLRHSTAEQRSWKRRPHSPSGSPLARSSPRTQSP